MYTTKFENSEVKIEMAEKAEQNLGRFGISDIEIYRLIESFAQKLLASKSSGSVRLENEDTKATIDIDIRWHGDKEAVIEVQNIDLNRVNNETLSNRPQGAMFDFNAPPEGQVDPQKNN